MKSPVNQALIAAIDELYAASLDGARWSAALEALSSAAGGVGAVIVNASQLSPKVLASDSLHEASVDYDKNGWWAEDVLTRAVISRGHLTGVVTELDLVPDEVFRTHPFVQEFRRRHGLGSVAGLISKPTASDVVSISIQREIKLGRFEQDELDTLKLLGAHAARALALGARFDQGTPHADEPEAFVARLSAPAIVLDENLRALALNGAAENMAGPLFSMPDAALVFHDKGSQDLFLRAASAALNGLANHFPAAGRDGVARMVNIVRMFDSTGNPLSQLLTHRARLLLTVTTAINAGDRKAALLQAHGLTPAETGIALLLAEGETPKRISGLKSVSVETVRVHIKNIYRKLDIHRQSDLIRLLFGPAR